MMLSRRAPRLTPDFVSVWVPWSSGPRCCIAAFIAATEAPRGSSDLPQIPHTSAQTERAVNVLHQPLTEARAIPSERVLADPHRVVVLRAELADSVRHRVHALLVEQLSGDPGHRRVERPPAGIG